jgi:hypothetical protein
MIVFAVATIAAAALIVRPCVHGLFVNHEMGP